MVGLEKACSFSYTERCHELFSLRKQMLHMSQRTSFPIQSSDAVMERILVLGIIRKTRVLISRHSILVISYLWTFLSSLLMWPLSFSQILLWYFALVWLWSHYFVVLVPSMTEFSGYSLEICWNNPFQLYKDSTGPFFFFETMYLRCYWDTFYCQRIIPQVTYYYKGVKVFTMDKPSGYHL